jgi:predicted amidohydrolase YtcJ
VHVIGDAAARRAIEGLEAARAANGPGPRSTSLRICNWSTPADRRLAGLATANIQPLWARL